VNVTLIGTVTLAPAARFGIATGKVSAGGVSAVDPVPVRTLKVIVLMSATAAVEEPLLVSSTFSVSWGLTPVMVAIFALIKGWAPDTPQAPISRPNHDRVDTIRLKCRLFLT
jgi:hypothetical protein